MAAPTAMFQFQTPCESTNYCLNPSAESTANFSAVATATVTRSSSYNRQVVPEATQSFRVQTAANGDGLSLTTAALPSATTYVSVWIRGTFANLQFKINATTVTPTLYETDGAWSWYVNEATSFTGGQVSGQTAVQIIMDSGADCYIDDVVVQQENWTTSFHGSYAGCRWEGIAHESQSTLQAVVNGQPTLSAGRVYDFDDTTTLVISAALGLGLPDVDYLTIDTVERGRVFQSAQLSARVMSLRTTLVGGGLAALQSQRATLVDRVQPGELFIFRYRANPTYRGGTADVMTIPCTYTKGLEGALDSPFETVGLSLTAHAPLFQPQTDVATTLTTSTAISALGYSLTRRRGVWQRPASGTAPSALVYDIAVSSRGHIFAASTAAVWGWDGTTWVSCAAITGGSASAYCLGFDPAETALYVGGNFTAVGGVAGTNITKYTLPGTGVSGGTVTSMASVAFNGSVHDLAVVPTTSGHNVYVGGKFTAPGNYVAYYDGAAWGTISPNTLGASVFAMTVDAANNLYLGGEFTNAGAVSASAPAPTATAVTGVGNLTSYSGINQYYYYYRVAGVYAGETAIGNSSSGVTASTTADATLKLSVNLAWTAMSGVVGYAIYRDIQTDTSPFSAPAAAAASNYEYLGFTTELTYTDDGTIAVDTTRTAPSSNGTGGKRVGYLTTASNTLTAVTGRLVDSGAGASAGIAGAVYTLALADDNTSLYAGGAITACDGETASKVAQWTGGAWLPMGDGVSGGDVRSLAFLPEGALGVGGAHTSTGATTKLGTAAAYLSLWHPGEQGMGVWTHGGVVLPATTVYALAVDHNGDVWLGCDSNGAGTAGALTSVSSAASGGGLLSYPRIYVKGPGLLKYLENETTGHRVYLNLWVASGELTTLDLRAGYKIIVSGRGDNRLTAYLGGDLGRLGLRNGSNRIICLMTSTDANTLLRMVDSGGLLSADG